MAELETFSEASVFDSLNGESRGKATVVVGSVGGELLVRRALHRTTLSGAGVVALDAPLPNVRVERSSGMPDGEWAMVPGYWEDEPDE